MYINDIGKKGSVKLKKCDNLKRLICIMVVFAIVLSANVNATTIMASSSPAWYNTIYETFSVPGVQELQLSGFINYSDNTEESIKILAVGFWVNNISGMPVDIIYLETCGGNQENNYVAYIRDSDISYAVGTRQRYEKDWEDACYTWPRRTTNEEGQTVGNNVFIKNNSAAEDAVDQRDYVYVRIGAGASYEYVPCWEMFWFATGLPTLYFRN